MSSLAECNPQEKAWLVLLEHIGRMVGEARTLHPIAAANQPAAYQRQAAQRLVAQLEDYAGAMLCDGVGLGKTYVATTVLVHYANAWRDRLAESHRAATDDPFRITILAPNSVVSTWQREAIPPLAAHGVPLATVRVISHSKLSRILPTSAILTRTPTTPSDMEHLLLSDLVVVDEAHNFRSVGARRTTILRDLLRLQPRKDHRRKVLLLTATPVNNSLEDLRQQAALLFSKPLWFNDNITPDKYRARALKDVHDRLDKAARAKTGDTAALLIHGRADARFAYAPDFRDDIQFGVQVPRVGDYLKEQEKRLTQRQATVRAAMQSGQRADTEPARIAGELLDRIVVQRSRALCKQIEREQGSDIKLLFRPDAPEPERLIYEDIYDDTRDVLARFLPLFDTGGAHDPATPPLSLKIYMWADVRDGLREATEVSSVVGLQRILVLKRLESSPVAFLITLLRLLALHARRLEQLSALCHDLADRDRAALLDADIAHLLDQLTPTDRDRLDQLLGATPSRARGRDLLARWSDA
ncbi:MAG: SNF2-related protein, partial [bacterium]